MKILSNEEIRIIKERTLEAQGITSIELIERAAAAIAKEIKPYCVENGPILVLAGWGNNGANALETARLLASDGYASEIFLFNIGGKRLSEECATMRDRVKEISSITLHEIRGNEPFQWADPPSDSLIIDGLFGSGLNRPLPRTFQLLARNVNQSGARVISIDVPSGLFTEWNGEGSRQNMMHAMLTLAIEFPRLAFMMADNADVVGQWKVVRIGHDSTAVKQAPFSFFLVDRALVSHFLPQRKNFSSKDDYGNAIIFAGSRGMMGAAILSARAALRTGAGKVTVYSASSGYSILQSAVPCAMFKGDKDHNNITVMPFDGRYNAMGVGPGIGTADNTVTALEKFVKSASAAGRRIILDADALNIIAKRPIILNYLPPLSIITPHKGEFDRIFGESYSDEERLKKAIKCAEDYSLIIVLKGHYTAIIRPDGKIMFNPTGTPALATGGSGDVLTGIITGLMAIGLESEIAALAGPYIHGIAGSMAAKVHGTYGVTAEDIVENIGKAIAQIMDNKIQN